MHFAICTFRNLVNLSWLELKIFFKEKNRVSKIYSCFGRFIFLQKFMIKYKSSMFASRHVCIYFVKNTWSYLRCCTYTLYLYKVFTRHLNMECFESAVPAIFLSNSPTFFHNVGEKMYKNFNQGKTSKLSFFNEGGKGRNKIHKVLL